MTALTLNRLAARDIEAMIDGVVGNNLIPPSIRQDIIVRTNGIPLFVEVAVNRVNIVDAYFLSYLARAYADLGNFDEALRSIDAARTAMETTKER